MYAYIGTNIQESFNPANWVTIPFIVDSKANDVEYEFEGGADLGSFTFDGNQLEVESGTDIYIATFETDGPGESRLVLKPQEDDDGDNPTRIEGSYGVGIWANNTTSDQQKKWLFGTDGNLKLPAGGDIVNSDGESVLGGGGGSSSTLVNGNFVVAVQPNGSLLLPTGDYQENESRYQGAILSENESSTIYMDVQTASPGNVYGGMRLETWNSVPIDIRTRAGGQGDDIKNWRFDSNGSITFPDDTVQTTAYTGVVRQDTAPTAANGTLWFNTVEGRLYIKYSDVWVDAAPLVQPPPDTDLDVNSITFPDASVLTSAADLTSNKLVNGDYELVLGTNGTTKFPNNVIRPPLGDNTTIIQSENGLTSLEVANGSVVITATTSTWTFGANGTLSLPTSSNDLYTTNNALIKSFADIQIAAGDDVGSNWIFGGDGTLTFPSGNLSIGNAFGSDSIVGSTGTVVGVIAQGQNGAVGIQWIDNIENIDSTSTQTLVAAVIVNGPLASTTGTVQIVTGFVNTSTTATFAEHTWEFGVDGSITFPDNTTQTTAYTGGGGGDSYTPEVPEHWNDPTVNTVAAALDELAARLTVIQNYEIDGGNAYTPPQGEFIIDGNGA
jgi:hypothetical protein